MEDKYIIHSSNKIEISQSEDESYLNLKFIISDFSVNGNGVKINRDKFEEWMNTLILKPLVGKIAQNKDNEDDFTGHQAKRTYEYEGNQLVEKLKFGTEAFGVFEKVSIEEIDGIEYIVAWARVWKRFEKCCEILQRKVENNEDIHTSWEISIESSHNETIEGKKVRVIDDGIFLGHALLGKYVIPAFKCSKLLEVAEEDEEYDIYNAFIYDINNIQLSSQSDDVSVEDIEENKGGEKMEGKGKVENSALTTGDLCSRIRKAIYSTEGNGRYYYNVLVYPFDFVAYAKIEGGDAKEEDWAKFNFTINSDDTISITSSEDVQMVFIPKSNQEEAIAELEEKVKNAETSLSEKETELSEKLGEIIKLGETIKGLETTVSELQPYKEKVEEAEAKAKEEEAKKKKEELCESLTKDGFFTQEEVSSNEEIQTAISEMDENKIKLILAERIIEKNTEKASKEEVSEKEEKVETSTDINAEMQCDYSDVDTSLNWLQSRRNKRR